MTDNIIKERKRLLNYIRGKVSSELDAEDILQDVFYQFYENNRSESIDKISAWLFSAARNKIIDWYRKKKPVSLEDFKIVNNGSDDVDGKTLGLVDILNNPTDKPDEIYIRSQIWPLLADSLDELPEEQKEVFIMNELEDISFKDISKMTGVPANTLISRKRYAVLFLRERLKDLYNEFY